MRLHASVSPQPNRCSQRWRASQYIYVAWSFIVQSRYSNAIKIAPILRTCFLAVSRKYLSVVFAHRAPKTITTCTMHESIILIYCRGRNTFDFDTYIFTIPERGHHTIWKCAHTHTQFKYIHNVSIACVFACATTSNTDCALCCVRITIFTLNSDAVCAYRTHKCIIWVRCLKNVWCVSNEIVYTPLQSQRVRAQLIQMLV